MDQLIQDLSVVAVYCIVNLRLGQRTVVHCTNLTFQLRLNHILKVKVHFLGFGHGALQILTQAIELALFHPY